MWRVFLTIVVLIATAFMCALPSLLSFDNQIGQNSHERKVVKVFSARGDYWVAWKSDDAIKFSLDQVVTTIHYLFAAAAAGMAFVGKIVIEPHATTSTAPRILPRQVLYLLVAAVSLWLGSLSCGMIAHLFLAEIGTADAFSIYGPLGMNVLFQLIYFGSGLSLFVVALIYSIQ